MRPNSKDIYRRLMILKYVISHSYRNIPVSAINNAAKNWNDSDKDNFERELKKNMEETVSSIKDYGLWKYLTKKEKDFLSSYGNKMDVLTQMNSSWRMEAAIILMWVLKIIENYPDLNGPTNPETLKKVEIKKIGLFSSNFNLRPYSEVYRMRDIIETWHWRVNTHRLIQDNYKFEPDEIMKKTGIHSLDDIVRMTAKSAYESGDIKEIIDEDFVYKGRSFRDLTTADFHEASSIIIERHYALNWLCGYAPNNNWDETPTDT